MSKKVLAFDFGASSGRAMIGSLDNGKINIEEIHRFSNDTVIVNGRMHWDILRLFFEIKTAINKAQLQRINYELELKDKQTQLYSTIENYWIQASTNQSMFKAAKVSTESAVTSYELLSEQFRLGLKNIVELLTGRDNMLKAQQSELQSKYLTMLNLNMLNFYQNGRL